MKKLVMIVAFLIGVFAVVRPAESQILRKPVPQVVVVKSATSDSTAEAKKPGAAFCVAVRIELAKAFRKQGHGFLKARLMANQATDEVIASVVADAETLSGAKVVGTAIGDGKIIDAILDWLKTPQGQAFIDAILKLLLGLLAVADPGSPEYFAILEMIQVYASLRT